MTIVSWHQEIAGSFRGPQVCVLAGITYRKLDYWQRTDLVTPSVAAAAGSGTSRRYSMRDVLQFAVIEELTRVGVSLRAVRRSIGSLRELPEDPAGWAPLIVVWTTKDIFVVDDPAELLATITNADGPLGALPLAALTERLVAGFAELGVTSPLRDTAPGSTREPVNTSA